MNGRHISRYLWKACTRTSAVRHLTATSSTTVCADVRTLQLSSSSRHHVSRLMTTAAVRLNATTAAQTAAATSSSSSSSLSAVTVTKTVVAADRRQLDVMWNDGSQSSYPYVWLRDNCQCSTCLDTATRDRKLLFHQLDLNAMPADVQTNSATQEVVVTWSDDHRSAYQYGWLVDRSFRYAEQQTRTRWHGRPAKLWKSDLADNVVRIRFDEYMSDDRQLYNWLTAMEETGFAVLTNVPTDQGQIHRIAGRVSYLRQTALGETSFENTSQETSTDVSRTIGSQELHNDLVYYYNVPGVKLVHCISGETDQVTQFVDGFHVAKQLERLHPDEFRRLSTVKLDFIHPTRVGAVMSRHQTIKLDEEGDVIQVHYSTRSRDAFHRQPVDEVARLYFALKTFAQLLYDPASLVEMQLKPGTVYCFNNMRVLHGRKEFQLTAGRQPVIERGYMDWDELHAKRRVLRTTLAIPDDEY